MRRLALPACLAAVWVSAAAAAGAQAVPRDQLVRSLLDSRLLENVQFSVPVEVYRTYLREKHTGLPPSAPAPLPFLAEEGLYQLKIDKDGNVLLEVSLRLAVFEPTQARGLPMLSAALAWEKVSVNGKAAELPTIDGWLRLSPAEGPSVLTATVPLKEAPPSGGALSLAIPPTVRTLLRFDSPQAWQVQLEGAAGTIRGSAPSGTAGLLGVAPRSDLKVAYRRPAAEVERAARYQLSGQVAWNLDAAAQQVTASLRVAILGGRSDRIDLLLPPEATQVSVSGPDVRESRSAAAGKGGTVSVFLRGKIADQTHLTVRYELPPAGAAARLSRLDVADGAWSGGTLVVTNTAGGSEVLGESLSGLRELSLSEIPPEALAILAGPPALAYQIVSRDFSAALEIVDLGELALQESIADLAHYEVSLRDGGAMMCKAGYEIRNRTRQFLRVELPAGSQVLLAKVNEKSVPLTPAPGAADAYLLPMVRSTPSVQGLVSFPVEVVFLCRLPALDARGRLALPLPRVDVPVAYAWAQAYLPAGLKAAGWSGPLRPVETYSSQTATASLDYGRGELAEGYAMTSRPQPQLLPPPGPRRVSEGPKLSFLGGRGALAAEAPKAPAAGKTVGGGWGKAPQQLLAANSYRAGKDFYDQGDFANARESLEKVVELSPESNEAANAKRLLSNIDLAGGKLSLKTKEQKAAGAQVKSDIAAANQPLFEQQQKFVEQARQFKSEGKYEQAMVNVKAAESVNKELLSRGGGGGGSGGGNADLGTVQRELDAWRSELAEHEQSQRAGMKQNVEALKARGENDRALQEARKLQALGGDVISQSEVEELAVRAAKDRAKGLPLNQPGQAAPNAPYISDMEANAADNVVAHSITVETIPGGAPSGMVLGAPFAASQPAAGLARSGAGSLIVTDHGGGSGVAFSDNIGPGSSQRAIQVDDNLDRAADQAEISGTISRPSDIREAEIPPSKLRVYSEDWKELASKREPFAFGRAAAASQPAVERPSGVEEQYVPAGSVGGGRAPREQAPARVYDVRDLVTATPAGKPLGEQEQRQRLDDLKRKIREVGGDGPAPRITLVDGKANQLIVQAAPQQQRAIQSLLEGLEQAQGPAVQLGENIARQGALQPGKGFVSYNGDVTAGVGEGRETDGRLREFIERNYSWQQSAAPPVLSRVPIVNRGFVTGSNGTLIVIGGGATMVGGTPPPFGANNYTGSTTVTGGTIVINGGATLTAGQTYAVRSSDGTVMLGGQEFDADEVARKLELNLGQKVALRSRNILVDPSAAAAVGVQFQAGNNSLQFALADEAQVRTLLELEARRAANSLLANEQRQETVVGTQALLSNGMIADLSYASDRGNTFNVLANGIDLPHEKYLLISNGETLTALRAGAMQFWTEQPADVSFAEVPEHIDLPRAGRELKFEKTLLKPTDALVLKADYIYEGAAK